MDLAEKFMPKCPVCKRGLSLEMVAIGNDPKEEKRKPKFDIIIAQIIRNVIERMIRAYPEAHRNLYYSCNNGDCPCCWKVTNQVYFKNTSFGPVLVGDTTGVMIDFYKARYRKKEKGGGKKKKFGFF